MSAAEDDPKKRRFGRARRVGRSVIITPRQAMGWDAVKDGSGYISALWHLLRSRRPIAPGLSLGRGGTIDLVGTAVLHGVKADALEALLREQQTRTYHRAMGALVFDAVLMFVWLTEMLVFHWNGSRLLAALEFMPFWAFLALVGFRNAWLNWQLRNRRIGSAREFLMQSDTLLPRLP